MWYISHLILDINLGLNIAKLCVCIPQACRYMYIICHYTNMQNPELENYLAHGFKKKKSISEIHFSNLKLAFIQFYIPNDGMHLLNWFMRPIQDFKKCPKNWQLSERYTIWNHRTQQNIESKCTQMHIE